MQDTHPIYFHVIPSKHWVLFIGGWEHSTKDTKKIKTLPKFLSSIASSGVINHVDFKSACKLGLYLLGDINGTSLLSDNEIPDKLVRWLLLPDIDGSKYTDIVSRFSALLKDCFGKPSFIELNIK